MLQMYVKFKFIDSFPRSVSFSLSLSAKFKFPDSFPLSVSFSLSLAFALALSLYFGVSLLNYLKSKSIARHSTHLCLFAVLSLPPPPPSLSLFHCLSLSLSLLSCSLSLSRDLSCFCVSLRVARCVLTTFYYVGVIKLASGP